MNFVQLRCIVEVSKTGSFTKAAENLLMAQPNLSRSIIDAEKEVGQKIFNRESRGVTLTDFGKRFCAKATKLVEEFDSFKDYLKEDTERPVFSFSGIKASYLSNAFRKMVSRLHPDAMDLSFIETNTLESIENIAHNKCDLAVIRYNTSLNDIYEEYFRSQKLKHETLKTFSYLLTINRYNPLNLKGKICFEDLTDYIHADKGETFVLNFPADRNHKDEVPLQFKKQIHLSEAETLFELVKDNRNAYFWSAPIDEEILKRYDCVQRECEGSSTSLFADVLLYKESHELNSFDQIFIEEVKKAIASSYEK